MGDQGTMQDPEPNGTETVLVVEDSKPVANVVRRMLEQHGYKVITASSAGTALRLAATLEPPVDLLLTDVVMPDMSGRELVEKFAAFQPKVRILYMSGFTDDAVIRQGVLRTTMPFLQKPFTPWELAIRVRQVLDA